MLKCAWCNGKNLVKETDKIISNDIRTCPDCGGRNSFVAVPYENDPDGFVTAMIPTRWAGTGEGLKEWQMPRKTMTDAEGQRELNNLLAGRTKRE